MRIEIDCPCLCKTFNSKGPILDNIVETQQAPIVTQLMEMLILLLLPQLSNSISIRETLTQVFKKCTVDFKSIPVAKNSFLQY